MDLRYHFIRELLSRGDVILEYVRSEHNQADTLTKPLCKNSHHNAAQTLRRTKDAVRDMGDGLRLQKFRIGASNVSLIRVSHKVEPGTPIFARYLRLCPAVVIVYTSA